MIVSAGVVRICVVCETVIGVGVAHYRGDSSGAHAHLGCSDGAPS